jgi:hypothetical protein
MPGNNYLGRHPCTSILVNQKLLAMFQGQKEKGTSPLAKKPSYGLVKI